MSASPYLSREIGCDPAGASAPAAVESLRILLSRSPAVNRWQCLISAPARPADTAASPAVRGRVC